MSEEEQQRRRQGVRDVMPKTPFIGGLGMQFERRGRLNGLDTLFYRLPRGRFQGIADASTR